MINKKMPSNKKILLFGDEVLNLKFNKSAEETEICLYGQVRNEDFNLNQVINKIKDAIATNQNLTIRINCYGGSAIDGLVIYDLLNSSENNVTVIIEGIVSDFSIPIALAGSIIKMTENAFFNIESVKSLCIGSKDVLMSEIIKLENVENKLFNIFKNRILNHHEEKIKDYLNDFNGIWLDAETSKEFNLCDEIIKPVKKRKFETDEKISALLITPENSNPTTIKASEYLKEKNDWTFTDWQNNDPKGLEKLYFRFPETFENLFNKQFSPQKDVNNLNNNYMNSNEKKDWTFTDWQEKDPNGLQAMYSDDFKKFQQLFNAQYPNQNSVEYPSTLPQDRKNWTFADWQTKDADGLKNLYNNHREFAYSLK